MEAFHLLRSLNHSLARFLKWALVLIFLILVVDVLWGVGSRYLFGTQASWSEELARILMVWLALLGSALVCREEGHLGLDVLVRSWPIEVQRRARLFVTLVVIAFAAGVLTWGGFHLVQERFASGQSLPALGVARGWFYVALPVSGGLMTLFMIESFLGTLMNDPSEPDSQA